ncbi:MULTISPECIES: signal peptidase I [Carnobacterium]|jgi:signal peptidase I|uniref:Signal peptidase I n=2 Tax=Carnobacterium maltaromaticum TaxID=2751 RepID=K8E389_CARML|nr:MULTISPECIES: signal peptidase I [Carnobacterium]AOA01598.1 signal peptidase I [Carnobacterium maltaromaticum]KRN60748.1 type I signal peptidase [Carnobacterium maltaromaticum DSM 20342]KRN71550.1 type I signal peptidase [Carnobacterium maltaromaticum]MBC9787084.1 signal peptidase I [Carnobacterium maltaromaticum]MBC9808455.1 signal peptidase I [Carnobacterium maltaromaticum]
MSKKMNGKSNSRGFIRELFSTLITLAVALTVVLLLRTFIFSPVIVKGESMSPTLANSDRILLLKMEKVKRFSIVTFPAPDDPSQNYVKRVIGLPGDSISYKNDVLEINGKAYEEPYLDEYKAQLPERTLLTNDFTLEQITGDEVVPEGEYLVLGDNRQNSKDSRMIGYIKADDIQGVADYRIWPIKTFGRIDQ